MQAANKPNGSSPLGSPSIVRRADAALGLIVSGFSSMLYKCGVPVPSEVAFDKRMAEAERAIAASRKAREAINAESATHRTSTAIFEAKGEPPANNTPKLG
jgi:hypothetical protein